MCEENLIPAISRNILHKKFWVSCMSICSYNLVVVLHFTYPIMMNDPIIIIIISTERSKTRW